MLPACFTLSYKDSEGVLKLDVKQQKPRKGAFVVLPS